MIWFAFAALTLAALAFLLIPLSRMRDATRDRAQADLGVYRAQLAELETEVGRGLIGPSEAEAARLEIQRRLLKADAAGAERHQTGSPRLALITIVAIAVIVPVFATLLYLRLGNPGLPGQPLDEVARERAAETEKQLAQVTNLVDRLRQHLIEQPADLRNWLVLGNTLSALQRFPEAATAYETATRLNPQDATIQIAYGEALVNTADGSVTPAAAAAFTRAAAIDAKSPTARYYLGLAKLQDGNAAGAYDDWMALVREAPPDAAYLPILRERLTVVGRTIGRDPSAAFAQGAGPGPSREQMQAAAGMNEQDRSAMIRSMVDNLAAKLAAQPDDFDGWMRLARARTVLRELPESRAALAQALRLRPADPDALFLAGQAAAAGGDKPAALDHWKRLLALLPAGSDDARAVEAAIARLEKT